MAEPQHTADAPVDGAMSCSTSLEWAIKEEVDKQRLRALREKVVKDEIRCDPHALRPILYVRLPQIADLAYRFGSEISSNCE